MMFPQKWRGIMDKYKGAIQDDGRGDEQSLREKAVGYYRSILRGSPFARVVTGFDLVRLDARAAKSLERYHRRGREEDLSDAFSFLETGLELASADSFMLPELKGKMAMALHFRYHATSHFEILQQAITFSQQALDLTPLDSSRRQLYLNNLAALKTERYKHTGHFDELQEIIPLSRQAVELTTEKSADWRRNLNNLALVLFYRYYYHTGKVTDLEQAITYWRRIVSVIPQNDPHLLGHLNNLATRLHVRYLVYGDLNDLDEAIVLLQKALDLKPQNPFYLARTLANFGLVQYDRYQHTGEMAALGEAVRVYRQSLDLGADSRQRPISLTNLSKGLLALYWHTNELSQLKEVIFYSLEAVVGQEALAETSAETVDLHDVWKKAHPKLKNSAHMPAYLQNLHANLQVYYEQTHDLEILNLAIEISRQAIAFTSENAPNRAAYLGGLGINLIQRYQATNELDDIEEAISIYLTSVELTPPNSLHLPPRLGKLGRAFAFRYDESKVATDLEKSQAAYRESCQKGLIIRPEVALRYSGFWGDWALKRKAFACATEAYEYGYEAIDKLLRVQVLREWKESWIRELWALHANAGYAYARQGKLEDAVTTLERGRAFILSETLERERADLERLPDLGHAELYQSYRRLVDQLFVLSTALKAGLEKEANDLFGLRQASDDLNQLFVPSREANDLPRLQQARDDLDKVIAEIQEIEGYQDFFSTPTFQDVQKAITEGQVLVYTAVTPVGGLALIVQSDGKITPLWRNKLTQEALRKQMYGPHKKLGGYWGAYSRWQENQNDLNWYTRLEKNGKWLWKMLMGSLMREIEQISARKKLSSVVLIPQGLLGLLPLHAAWTKEPSTPTGRRYALDSIRITYAPNARALTAAQQKANIPPDKLLVIDNPDGSLNFSSAAVAAADVHFPQAKVLTGQNATREAVQAQLPAYPVLYFWTHGQAHIDEPLSSHLKLTNGTALTLRDIFALQLNKARLAILSACETGIPGAELPDEVVSLPTGLVQAGVPSVIASLWAVSEVSTMMLMARFYDLWQREGLPPAEALRQAQIWLRDTTNEEKTKYFKKGKYPAKETVRQARRWLNDKKRNPSAREFAHPFHWAAFGYTGV